MSFFCSGGEGNRTHDLLNAIQTLYQLSYTPESLLITYATITEFNNRINRFIVFNVSSCLFSIHSMTESCSSPAT